ncbi:MAG: hypothetical protein KAX49_15670 [Halanaerobiales bacterium]|nr:hypothetical protein [Halanaerobiales bacterium]
MKYDVFLKYKEYVFLFIVFILGAFSIYFFGLKSERHELRKKNKFVKYDDFKVPKMFEKNILDKRIFIYPGIQLFIFSVIISLFICLFYLYILPSFKFNTYKDMLSSLFVIVPIYAMFLDVSVSKELFINKQNSKVFGNLYASIAWVKVKILNSIITTEQSLLYDLIRKNITQWYNDWYEKKDLKFGILVLRIDEDYLDKLLPLDYDRENIMDIKREIILLYGEDGLTLVDMLNRFFTIEVEKNKIIFEDILRFIKTVEIASKNQDRSEIEKKLVKCVAKAQELNKLPSIGIDKNKEKDLSELDSLLSKKSVAK